MDSLLKIALGPIPIGFVILIVCVANYIRVKDLARRVERLENHFTEHLERHTSKPKKRGGET